MEATPIETEDPKVILRRVGNVLTVVGLADIAWMIYVVSSGHRYSSSFNIFAVIAGVLLRRGSLRTVRVVRVFAAFMFAAFAGLLVALPIIFPLDLIQTYLRITPASQLAGWGTFFLVVLALLWWVHQSLTATPVEMAIQNAKLGRPRLWHRPESGFVIGVGLVALLSIILPLSNRSESARQAIERARAQVGADHRYFVSSLATSWSSGSGTHVRATVLAYTDSSIESVEIEWRE
jgi:hypothetical protein